MTGVGDTQMMDQIAHYSQKGNQKYDNEEEMTSEVMHMSQNQTMTSQSNNQTTQISALVTPMKKINKLGQKTKVSHPGGSTQNSQTTAFQSRKNAPGSSN